jgi:outer membrane protein
MKTCVTLVALVAVMLLPVAVGAQTPGFKIGYVDLQKVMLESSKGKEAKQALGDEVEKVKKTLNQKQEELQKLKDTLEKQTAMVAPEARAQKEKDYQGKLKDYQRMANDYQTDLQQKESEMVQKVLKEVDTVIKSLGESEKYTLILERSQGPILYATTSIDVTDKVISLYDDSVKKKVSSEEPVKKKSSSKK